MAYRSLAEYIAVLEESDKLVRIKELVNKDTELMPLVRWQFRGLDESQRKAFLFEQVTDSKGRRYQIPVLVGALAASREIYALGMGCRPEEIRQRWEAAIANPVLPVEVSSGPVQEVIHEQQELAALGLEEFPFPISTPGLDNAPYTSDSHWVTRDLETGGLNVGNYRGQIKSRTRTGINPSPTQHISIHWKQCQERGIPLPAALVIGVPPQVAYASVSKLPYGVSEYAVAGGIAGEPVELVQCKTVDLLVPAQAEIVIEGYINTDFLEPEGPHGEYTGYIGMKRPNVFFEATCITHRANPILATIISQFPPSESSKIRQIGTEGVYYKFLKHDCNIPGIIDVAFHEASGSSHYCVIKIKKRNPAQPWQALNAAASFGPMIGKVFVAVDDDIDPWDPDSVNWAVSFRMQPQYDLRVFQGKSGGIDPSAAPPGTSRDEADYPGRTGTSAVLIDATRKWDYPPVSLPLKPYMERARELWEQLGLEPLQPKQPWYGYFLGSWSEEDAEEAALAVEGKYLLTGEKISQQRVAPRK